ncbi:hypothetical protein CGJ62_22330 [Vibrio parahaemolyticus]|uniref:tyrosine-type recombinase/integrase n=1 Tax=Vibrio parahaemolyticus TaxID=670 RepID=UPI00111CC6B9|nr:tyrosine-type recombinase/integrase [Vibrio parahaemolyticus]TOD54905.1 hypothetical protein CGJ62_22330 [Vibrio parahaemolyticus]
MNIRIEKITVNGEQSVFYTDQFGLPITGNLSIDHASNYICLEKGGTTVTSRETTARHLLFCLNYFNDQNINIAERVMSAKFLDSSELNKFSRHCYKKQEFIKETTLSNITSFTEKDSISPSTRQSTFRQKSVANTTVKERLRAMRGFLEYLFERFHYGTLPMETEKRHSDTIEYLKREIRKAKPQNNKVIDVDEVVFTEELLELIFEITQVGHPKNPFRKAQLRNRVIIETIFDTGLRRGALLGLKIGDIVDDSTPRIKVIKRVNTDDPRKHRPTQKTQSGVIGATRITTQNLKTYIETIRDSVDPKEKSRPLYPKATTHDFIFISEHGKTKGAPLSITGFNYIFEILSKALNEHISPHLIRHHWNYAFTQLCKAANLTNEEADKLRKNQMTWDDNSDMASIYNKRAILEKVREIKQGYQSQLFYTGDA